MEEYLKAILSAEQQAKHIEDEARAEAERVIAAAAERRKELLAQAEARAQSRLAELRAQAEAEGRARVAALEKEQTALIAALRERYQRVHTQVVDTANLDLSTLLSLARE